MAIDRRRFIGLGLATLFASGPVRAAGNSAVTRLFGCRSTRQGDHFLTGVDLDGRPLFDIPLPARGHGIAIDQGQGLIAVFARRPGDYVWIVDPRHGDVVARITAAPGRHFFGHGVFTPDGHLLCSENAYSTGDGVIGVYDVSNGGERIGEFQSHGIGPHEIRLLNDGTTLVVANGGIRTHPDLPRVKANLATMRPNLAYVDTADGHLLHRHEPPEDWHQLSIRHIDVAADDTIAVAMQFEGRPLQRPPLVAVQQGDSPLQLLSAPPAIQRRMRNYCGSVTFDRDHDCFAVTSPRGGLVTYWATSGSFLGSHDQADACGIAPGAKDRGFFVSDGTGQVRWTELPDKETVIQQQTDWHWDNHLVAASF